LVWDGVTIGIGDHKMALRTDPRLGFTYGWIPGDNDWGNSMNTNLQLLMLLFHLSVISDALTTPPGSPAIGDTYIPATGATGAWAGQVGNIAIWWQTPAQASPAWLFITRKTGMRGWVASASAMKVYNGSAWVAV